MQRLQDSFFTYREIISQTKAWQSVLDETSLPESIFSGVWQPGVLRQVVFTGCGSTYYLAQVAAAVFQGVAGVTAGAFPASEIALFPEIALNPIGQDKARMLVAVSRSGETSETLRAIAMFQSREKGPVIGITCYPDTPLTRIVPKSLVIQEAQETSVAQTRSFSSMLFAAVRMAFLLTSKPLTAQFAQLPNLGDVLIRQYLPLARTFGLDAALERFFFLGSGPCYGLACEGMLKMKEMSLSYAEAYHTLEFRHGPMSMVDPRTLIIGLISENAQPHEAALLAEMRALGARVLAITPAALSSQEADAQVLLPAGFSDLERCVLYLPVMQLLAFYRALLNGLNPDQPANLRKFVELDLAPIKQ